MEILIIGTLALVSVCLWTLRIEVTTRGHRRIAVPLAAVEAMVYVTAFGRILEDLGAPERVLAFGIGVAAGTFIAMVVADRAVDHSDRRTRSRSSSINAEAVTKLPGDDQMPPAR